MDKKSNIIDYSVSVLMVSPMFRQIEWSAKIAKSIHNILWDSLDHEKTFRTITNEAGPSAGVDLPCLCMFFLAVHHYDIRSDRSFCLSKYLPLTTHHL